MSDQQPEYDHVPGTISEADRAAIKRRSQDLGNRLERLRQTGAPERTAQPRSTATSAVGDAFKMAIEPAVGVVVGVGVGLMVDNALGSKPFGLIIGLLLGAAAGMLNLFRAAQRTTKSTSGADQAPPAGKPGRD